MLSGPAAGSCASIDEMITYRRTAAARAASASLTAPPRSTVRFRAAPLPGPAPAANTTASDPLTYGSRLGSFSRSPSTGTAPAAWRSAACSRLRISPRAVWPWSARIFSRRRAPCPCPPATRMSMVPLYPSGTGSGRFADDQCRLEGHRAGKPAGGADLRHQHLGHLGGHLLDRLPDGGEQRPAVERGAAVVETDHRHVVRHAAAEVLHRPQRALGHQVAGHEEAVEVGVAVEHPAGTLLATGPGEVTLERRHVGDAAVGQVRPEAVEPVLPGRHVQRTGDGAQPAAAAGEQVLGRQPGTQALVHVDVAERYRTARAGRHHGRDAQLLHLAG